MIKFTAAVGGGCNDYEARPTACVDTGNWGKHSNCDPVLTLYSPVVTICTAQWSLYVPHSGHYMYRTVVTICTTRLKLKKFYVLPTQCIYVFCVDLRTNSDYFPIQD